MPKDQIDFLIAVFLEVAVIYRYNIRRLTNIAHVNMYDI